MFVSCGWGRKKSRFCASKVGGIPFFCITPKSYPKTLQHWGAGIPFFCITPKFHPKSLQHLVPVSITRRFLAKIGGISARSCQKSLLLEVETRFFPKNLAPLHKNGMKKWSVAQNWEKKMDRCIKLGFFEVSEGKREGAQQNPI